jgi:hypothetical protein
MRLHAVRVLEHGCAHASIFVWPFGLLDDPHAPIAIPDVIAASAISRLKPFGLTIASVVADDR